MIKSLPKHTGMYIISMLLGVTTSTVFWFSWGASLEKVVSLGFLSAVGFVVSAIALLVIILGLFGITALLVTNNLFKLCWFVAVSVPVIGIPAVAPLLWRILIALILFMLFMLNDIAILRRSALLIRPVFSLIFPGFFKLWLFGLAVLLSITITVHPVIRSEEIEIVVPENVWNQLWEMFGVEVSVDESEIRVQGASIEETITPASNVLGTQDVQKINSGLIASGYQLPNLDVLLDSFSGLQFGSGELEEAAGEINKKVSAVAKGEIEKIFSHALEPILPFWPYLIALSFFLSVQILLPVFVLLGLLSVKVGITVLQSIGIVDMAVENSAITKYVLK